MFTVDRVQQWFKGKKDEFGRLKKANLKLKSGAAPAEWGEQSTWIWENFRFLWSEIHTKNVGTETQVGICIHHITDFGCVELQLHCVSSFSGWIPCVVSFCH